MTPAANNFQLRPFQERVFEHIMKGQSVILQAPTGSGKTRAALAPFIHNLGYQGNKLPLTCRYAVPTRTLANQFHHDTRHLASRIDDEMATRIEDEYMRIGRKAISIQTGEQSNDPQMEAALTFCTIDQLLASYLAVPYGVGKNFANLNVGAIIGSYLVLDEFHLYPLLRDGKSCFGALTTTIQMLRQLKATTPFVLMTATFSQSILDRLKILLDVKVEVVTDEDELAELAQGRERTFELSSSPMDLDAILKAHNEGSNKCTLIVCNTVRRAQECFLGLRERLGTGGPKLVLLHSRFTEERRQTLAEEVERELGPEQWNDGAYHGRDIIVVATQVVEVGLNISVQTLHTEIAPANSLIQRAGRCARFAKQRGSVVIYPLNIEEGGTGTLPYDKELCNDTWRALKGFDKQVVGFQEERILINEVHESGDKEMLKEYENNENVILDKIFKSFNENNYNVSSELIRDVAQVQILVHDNPNETITEEPWCWQSFAMHPKSLANWWEAIKKQSVQPEVEWICKQAESFTEGDPDEPDNLQKTKYRWVEITNSSEILSALMVVLPRKLARYDDDVGFVLLDGTSKGGEYQSTKREADRDDEPYKGSRQQSYQDHVGGLVDAYNDHLQHETQYIAWRLEQEMKLPEGMVDQAIRLAIACHDLGKLNKQWQQCARAWQRLVMEKQSRPYQPPGKDFFFAKTEYNYSRQQKAWQRDAKIIYPHHACESVVLGRAMIEESIGEGREKRPVLRAICGAIARHHTSQASQYSKVQLDNAALQAVDEALKKAQLGQMWSYNLSLLRMVIDKDGDLAPAGDPRPQLTKPENEGDPENELETLLYFVIVRALRLADQRA